MTSRAGPQLVMGGGPAKNSRRGKPPGHDENLESSGLPTLLVPQMVKFLQGDQPGTGLGEATGLKFRGPGGFPSWSPSCDGRGTS